VQPGAFFLGRRGPRGHALFRPACSRTSGGIPNLPDWITREAYSHEVSSCGFWAGGGPIAYPVFYSYAYPAPAGFADARVRPDEAFYSRELGEFLLPYDRVRLADSPDDTLLEFLQSTYEAAATLANWDRQSLERPVDPRGEMTRASHVVTKNTKLAKISGLLRGSEGRHPLESTCSPSFARTIR
jgi:hypothetical protein